mmetsp:Transcript_28490/g.43914  ORF Transcript_28490/g.43914 Transcript_28490/m.43914 type:complete len:388 (+) Transcript_28490:82-1245(+)
MSLTLGRYLFSRLGPSPSHSIENLERADILRALLLLTHRRLRLLEPSSEPTALLGAAADCAGSALGSNANSGILSSFFRRRKPIGEVRDVLHRELNDQCREIFGRFRSIDSIIEGATDGSEESSRRRELYNKTLDEIFRGDGKPTVSPRTAVADHLIFKGVDDGTDRLDGAGYAPSVRPSVLPRAGAGLFVSGKAVAGSILAYLPGICFLNEHLRGEGGLDRFRDDPDHQLSLRRDGHVLDCRGCGAPDRSVVCNPWALGQYANHPSMKSPRLDRPDGPNCFAVPMDYISGPEGCLDIGDGGDGDHALRQYIPNTYSSKPAAVLGMNVDILSGRRVEMRGMVLLATRDVQDEEVYYDYRLPTSAPESWPDWYTPVPIDSSVNLHDDL